jgi:hypothetical protein
MVSEEEWRQLSSLFSVDREISVIRNRPKQLNGSAETHSASLDNADENVLNSSPPVCQECVERRHQQELDERLVSFLNTNFNLKLFQFRLGFLK